MQTPSRKRGKGTWHLIEPCSRGKKHGCTYPGPSVVMMGFKPSFFLFLFSAELPLADAACDAAATGSLVCCAPFILHEW